jgi:predicted dehydrogenase
MSRARFATIAGTEPLRGVLVGAGKLGPYWARELLENPETELAGWVDLDAARVRAEADTLGLAAVPTGASLDEMLDARRPDFLVNVTAPAGHHPVTLTALARGVAVLSEKPLAATMAEALEMIAAADRAERLLMVSQNRRYMPALVAFRDTVARLGRLSGLTCEFYVAHRDEAAEFLFAFSQPLLLDMAIHLFDGARAITGASPLSVYCDAYNPPWSWYAGPAAANAIFQMTDELRFAFSGNWAADGFRTSWTGSWRAVGELGTATWDGESAPRVESRPGERIAAAPVPVSAPLDEDRFVGLAGALADFVAALRTGDVPAGECHDNIQSLAMCHAAVESAELGAPVPVATFTSGVAIRSPPVERARLTG